MIAHISDKLESLSRMCNLVDSQQVQGWDIDFWELNSFAVDAVKDAYEVLIDPPEFDEVKQQLLNDGIDLKSLLFDTTGANQESLERTIRADMVELAAAATLLSREHVPLNSMWMPNVPKMSRRQSSPGIDILGIILEENGRSDILVEGDVLFLVSVKHSVKGCSDLRYELDQSVSGETLSLVYLGQQLRVFHGRLKERGRDVAKILLVLRCDPILESKHLRVLAVGGVDLTEKILLSAQEQLLTSVAKGSRRLRWLLMPDIHMLHERSGS